MRLGVLAVFTLILTGGGSAPAADAPAVDAPFEALLVRLADHAARLEPIYTDGGFTIESVIEDLDRKGKVYATTEVETGVSYVGGVQREDIRKKIEKGVDVTKDAAARKRRDEERAAAKGERLEASRIITPFDHREQAKYRFTRVGPVDGEPGSLRISFKPAGEPSKHTWKGEAVVDEANGEMRTFSARPSKFPTFVDKLVVELDFDVKTSAGWAPGKLRVDGEGGLLFYRKHTRIRSTFSAYVVPE